MKSGDFVWLAVFTCIVVCLLYPVSQDFVVASTKSHPYIMGFIKFAILATMGELLAIRIVRSKWGCPAGLVYRSVVWGLIGAGLVIVFGIYGNGVVALIKDQLLPVGPFGNSNFVTAFWISTINNITFAPTLMLLHKISDTYLDLSQGRLAWLGAVKLSQVAAAIDWNGFLSLVIFKTIPFFWIPAHIITFSLPGEFRVLFAAFLSIALGGILGYAKASQAEKKSIVSAC